jgi:hypothetical protein
MHAESKWMMSPGVAFRGPDLGSAKYRGGEQVRHRSRNAFRIPCLLAAAVLLAQLVVAQARPKVTAVDPQAGKDGVSAVFLSDDTTDHKAVIVEQSAEKIVMKVPQLKAGSYNIGIQVGDQIFVLPLRFNVQE